MPGFQITEMTADHIEERGRVHYRAWEETYRGLMPAGFLDARSERQCIETARKSRLPTLVALVNGEVVGFVCYDAEAQGFLLRQQSSEIRSLYVLQAYQGKGIGTALLNAALERVPHCQVALLVLQGNEKAIAFYRRRGFAPTGRRFVQETGYGPITELEMLLCQ